MANGSVEQLGGGQVKLPNGDIWKGIEAARPERPDTVDAPTEAEKETNAELTEAALAQAVFSKPEGSK